MINADLSELFELLKIVVEIETTMKMETTKTEIKEFTTFEQVENACDFGYGRRGMEYMYALSCSYARRQAIRREGVYFPFLRLATLCCEAARASSRKNVAPFILTENGFLFVDLDKSTYFNVGFLKFIELYENHFSTNYEKVDPFDEDEDDDDDDEEEE